MPLPKYVEMELKFHNDALNKDFELPCAFETEEILGAMAILWYDDTPLAVIFDLEADDHTNLLGRLDDLEVCCYSDSLPPVDESGLPDQ